MSDFSRPYHLPGLCFCGSFEFGLIERAQRAGSIEIQPHDLRNWTYDRRRTVDDEGSAGFRARGIHLADRKENIAAHSSHRSAGKALIDQAISGATVGSSRSVERGLGRIDDCREYFFDHAARLKSFEAIAALRASGLH